MQIKDIARLAEVAPSTVSRVLNDSGYVSAEIRSRVEKVIADTGYEPNSIAKSLKAKKTNTIGVIIPRIASFSMASVIEAVTRECEAAGYEVFLANTTLRAEKEISFLKAFARRQIDGVVMMSVKITPEHVKLIESLDFPVVAVGQQYPGICCVTHDDRDVAEMVTSQFLAEGRRRVAMLNVSLDDNAVRGERTQGYRDALEKEGIPFLPERVAYGDFTISSGRQCMQQIWERCPEKPDAVFCVSDRMAVGALQYLKSIHIDVPEQCAIVGIGNDEISRFTYPSLSSVEYYFHEMGTKAAKLVLEGIENGKSSGGVTYIGYSLVRRDTF